MKIFEKDIVMQKHIKLLVYLFLLTLIVSFEDLKITMLADASPVIPKRRWKGYIIGDGDVEDYLKKQHGEGIFLA